MIQNLEFLKQSSKILQNLVKVAKKKFNVENVVTSRKPNKNVTKYTCKNI